MLGGWEAPKSASRQGFIANRTAGIEAWESSVTLESVMASDVQGEEQPDLACHGRYPSAGVESVTGLHGRDRTD